MDNIKVSIVIPAHNEEDYIEDSILSIKKQEITEPYEIIVVNNASTDSTAEVARKAGATVIYEKQKGLAFARQTGLDNAKGEFLIYMDADTRMTDGWMKKVLHYFDTHPDIVGISCNFFLYDGSWKEKIGFFLTQSVIFPIVLLCLRLTGKPDFFIGQAMAMRTESLRKAGGIDKSFVFFGEDTSMAMRLHTQGKVRFLLHLFVNSSARRYQREGVLKTLIRYFTTFTLMQAGRYRRAKAYADQQDQRVQL